MNAASLTEKKQRVLRPDYGSSIGESALGGTMANGGQLRADSPTMAVEEGAMIPENQSQMSIESGMIREKTATSFLANIGSKQR